MRRAAPAALVALVAGAAGAGPGVPGPDYFKGIYQRVGRDGATPPAPLDDLVRIEPDGTALVMRACSGEPVRLVFDPYGGNENGILGREGGAVLYCLFHNNGQNYPLLTCRSDRGALFTLWAVEDGFGDAELACSGNE